MHTQREPEVGSFRAHIDEIVTRLAHDRVVGAGFVGPELPVRKRSKSAARCPAYHNRALFERAQE
jgi:hypothetical protein